jgi:pterin-4a-carbinolamine dehydratase
VGLPAARREAGLAKRRKAKDFQSAIQSVHENQNRAEKQSHRPLRACLKTSFACHFAEFCAILRWIFSE